MKINSVKLLFALLALVFLLAQPCVFAGEHPWDGDSTPGGTSPGGTNGGSGNGGSGNSTTPSALTRFSTTIGSGTNIQIYIQGALYSIVVNAYWYISGNTKQSTSATIKATEKKNLSGGCTQLSH